MQELRKLIDEKKAGKKLTMSDYFLIDKAINDEIEKRKNEKNEVKSDKTLRIAIVTSSTTRGIKEALNVKCCEWGILPEFYVAPYNQCFQEVLNTKSALYQFKPELTIIFIDTQSLLGEDYYYPYRLSSSDRKKLVQTNLDKINNLIKTFTTNAQGTVILHNLELPDSSYSSRGILENREEFGFFEMLQSLNNQLRDAYKKNNKVFVFDYEAFCSKHGKQAIVDKKMYYLADMKLNVEQIPSLCEEYMAYIIPICSLAKKCLVLDLDNTLWGGVYGEEGMEGIRLGPEKEGKPFLELQKIILNLFERGVILAINSKNNRDDALEVLRKHPYMLLKEHHFASMQINWIDKVTNMKNIAKEINIGLDTLVFLDDDPLNRSLVKQELPEVMVVELPKDPASYPDILRNLKCFNTLQLTEEDLEKGKMYAEQRKRQEFEATAGDIDDFLKGLEMEISIQDANQFNTPRISQLTQKTNQFNLTTRRYLEEEIEKFSKDGSHLVWCINVKDKFGDNGITGVVIVKKNEQNAAEKNAQEKTWLIDTFLLSCRVLGRRVEDTLMDLIIRDAKKAGVSKIIGEFLPTKKNAPAKDFLKNSNFKLVKDSPEQQLWEFDVVKGEFDSPKFIKVSRGG
jgi:FkbH-like protein